MELYALIGIALIAVTLIHKKLTARPCEPVREALLETSETVRSGTTPMDIDEDMLVCTPLQPPSPMSTSETSSSDFVIDPEYIKK